MRHNIMGKIDIKYEKINGLAVPAATFGKSAIELYADTLVELIFNLRGENIKINTRLPSSLFEAGF